MNAGKLKTIEFINELELLSETINSDSIVKDVFNSYNELKYIERLIKEARELIQYNEWIIALENTISNLFEIDYKLNINLINLAIDAFKSCKAVDESILKCLREMKNNI